MMLLRWICLGATPDLRSSPPTAATDLWHSDAKSVRDPRRMYGGSAVQAKCTRILIQHFMRQRPASRP